MRKLLTQVVRATALDKPWNIRWQRVRVGADEEVDVIGLNGQPDDLPLVLRCHLCDDLLQAVA